MKDIIKQFIPPVLMQVFRPTRIQEDGRSPENDSIWKGSYSTWQEAIRESSGYDDAGIMEKCKDSLLKVKNGEAVYERDSVLFDKIQYSWPILACLENIALNNNKDLHVIDFGGSLGSSYFQNRHFLEALDSFKWIVVEQKHFVDCGKQEFGDDHLQFEYSIEDVLKSQKVHCLLLSGVLQYLTDPFEWIEKLCSYNIEFIILDRTGFVNRSEHLLTVQNVPQEIYNASYPCWFFNEDEFTQHFLKHYNVITEFNDSFTPPTMVNENRGYWKGFYMKRKAHEK